MKLINRRSSYKRTTRKSESEINKGFRPYHTNPYDHAEREFETGIYKSLGRHQADSYKRATKKFESGINNGVGLFRPDSCERVAEKIKEITKESFRYYGFKIKMKYYGINLYDALIYRVRLPKGKKFRNFSALVAEVQRDVGLPCEVFEDDYTLYLAISLRRTAKIYIADIIYDAEFEEYLDRMDIPVVIGCDLRGKIIVKDLAKLYHLLVAGASGSGKSAFLHCLILCIIARQPVQKVNLILLDFGLGGLTMFDGVHHLSHSVVTNSETAKQVIFAVVTEMKRRYNHPEEHDKWPFLVIFSDESSARVTEFQSKEDRDKYTDANSNLLRLGRKVKIIVIQVAQEISKASTKIEMANFTTKIAFTCSDYHQSISILGVAGAEKLPGNGAMLFKTPGDPNPNPNPIRLQGAYIKPDDIKEFVAELAAEPYDPTGKFVIPEFDTMGLSEDTDIILENCPPTSQEHSKDEKRDKELCDIILWALGRDTISAYQIIKHFKMSNRASDIMRKLTELGIVGERVGKQAQKVLCKCAEDISDEVIIFLTENEVSVDTIEEAFQDHPELRETGHDQ